ncbi:TonB-dependent receptor [Elizabethkingia meningoseptica]|uniref:TonB-dependent receptor n=1 Tax=Elizabethkingia meningoseptica TaxID=238 RepID=UPI000841722D|nr:TonB-dependent receptor [Elizabethkingia meningoseptica]ODM52553.1 TonB-dependent receptor [Elizabethkingia meningoseptica]OHT27464.1 TonB-dependent receptor [Elizabethkingia meningoseptica]OPC12768.1 TonB-dependent receptor [Elizabethkingia meningoseptica]
MKKNYQSIVNLKNVLLFAGIGFTGMFSAQNVSFASENLTTRLQKISLQTGRNIAFDTAMLQNANAPFVEGDAKSAEQLIRKSLSGTAFTYRPLGQDSFMIVQRGQALGRGRISGRILDEVGTPVVGAVISINPGGETLVTGNNGDFTIELSDGQYTLTIKAKGYSTTILNDVIVKNNETNQIALSINPIGKDEQIIKEVTISAAKKQNTVSGLLAKQKKAAELSDGISAEQIAKTPDNDAGDAIKRITGLSTVDNKFVVVRGMGERWNETALDGVVQPSTDPTRKMFSFDLIPTSVIDNIIVSKTATPDMNANFAGGFVQIVTKDIPTEPFFNFSMGSSYNDISTFKEQLGRKVRKYDYLAFDDGSRDLPIGQVKTLSQLAIENGGQAQTNPELFDQSKLFKYDNFTTYRSSTPLGIQYQASGGTYFNLSKRNNNKLGFVAALSYRNRQEQEEIKNFERGNYRRYFTNKNGNLEERDTRNTGGNYEFNTTWSALFNVGAQIGKNRFTLRNIYSRVFDQRLNRILGWSYDDASVGTAPNIEEVNRPVFSALLQNKLEGAHQLGKVKWDWAVSRTEINRDQKDVTYTFLINKKIGDEYFYYTMPDVLGNTFKRMPIGRGSYLYNEKDYNWETSFSFPFMIGNLKSNLKAGYFGTTKEATQDFFEVSLNAMRVLGSGAYLTPQELLIAPISVKLDQKNYNSTGFAWVPTWEAGNRFEGKVDQHAPYLMIDNRWKKFRLVWGLKAEYYQYRDIENTAYTLRWPYEGKTDDKKWQFLPSVNFTYNPWSNFNFRLAYSKSVIRPQFSERNKYPYYEPIMGGEIFNMPIISSVANNYDFKAEWYPSPGELISVGLYYKNIDDPVELYRRITPDAANVFTRLNTKNAKVKGIEVDIQKDFGFISEGLKNLKFIGNFSVNETKVKVEEFSSIDEDGTSFLGPDGKAQNRLVEYEDNRPLYGQSPYVFNLGLGYFGDRLGVNVLYNKAGKMLNVVSFDEAGKEYLAPYGKADAQISYKLMKNKQLEIKLNISNIFNEDYIYYNNENSYQFNPPNSDKGRSDVRFVNPAFYKKYATLKEGWSEGYDTKDNVLYRFNAGRRFTLSFTYNF